MLKDWCLQTHTIITNIRFKSSCVLWVNIGTTEVWGLKCWEIKTFLLTSTWQLEAETFNPARSDPACLFSLQPWLLPSPQGAHSLNPPKQTPPDLKKGAHTPLPTVVMVRSVTAGWFQLQANSVCVCIRGTFGMNVDSKISFLLLFLCDLLWSFEFLWQQEFSCKVKDKIWFSPSVIQSGICSKMLWCPSATVSSTTAVTWCTCHGLLLWKVDTGRFEDLSNKSRHLNSI